jgi:toxin-antitoxin system PIN domain toxin
VIVPDVNLLLHAANIDDPRHAPAVNWLEELLSSREQVGFAWSVLVGFVRIASRPGAFLVPLTPSAAFDIVEKWLGQPNVEVLEPTTRHLSVLRGLVEPLGTGGNLIPDAHLAALAIEHGGTVASRDHDFGRFRGLKWVDPLAD